MDSLTGINLRVMNVGSSTRSRCKRVRNQDENQDETIHMNQPIHGFEVGAKRMKLNTENWVRDATPSVSVKTEPLQIEIPSLLHLKLEPFSDDEITSFKTEFMPFMTEKKEIEIPSLLDVKCEPFFDEEITSLITELMPLVTEKKQFIKPKPVVDSGATIKVTPSMNVERTCWKKPVPLAHSGVTKPTHELRPALSESKATERTTQQRTPVPLADIVVTKPTNEVPPLLSEYQATGRTTQPRAPVSLAKPRRRTKRKTNRAKATLCELNEDLQTAEHKKMYQVTALDQLKSHRRPGHSVVQLKCFTSSLEGYVNTLKVIDPRFMHSTSIMKAVCSKLEPYILSSWCDYAAQYAKGGKPLILTMLDFLHQKVNTGFQYWYPYTKEAANSKS